MQVLEQVNLDLKLNVSFLPNRRCEMSHTMITRSSLFGRSANLICLTATVSPVPQLRAR